MTSTVFAKIQMRRGTAAEWAGANPILSEGEFAFETDTGITKVGDGATDYATLPAYATYDQIIAAQQAAEVSARQADQSAIDADGSAGEAAADRAIAQNASLTAQSARDAAFVNAQVFDDVPAGLSGTSAGDQFQVVDGDVVQRYRHAAGGSAVLVASYPAARFANALAGAVGQLSAILGQVQGQIDGGQVALKGGTLAAPALRIGTVGVYSSAADTLSIAIAGSEVARFTASGLTVYGTVTEA